MSCSRSAAGETVLIRSQDGHAFVLEAADLFEQEVTEFAASGSFMSFLAQRSKEQASIPLSRRSNRGSPTGDYKNESEVIKAPSTAISARRPAASQLRRGKLGANRGR